MPTSGETSIYLDASALVKLVVPEDESRALRSFIRQDDLLTSSAVAETEVLRAVRQHGPQAVVIARGLLRQVDLVQLDDELLEVAAEIDEALRTLDAIHVASALELAETLKAVVTYDLRMARAATALGLPVVAPA